MHFQIYAPEQFLLLVKAIILGAGIGVFYDFFRILRIAVKTHSVIIFLEDLIFFICAAIATFFFIFQTNTGQIRWFIFFGLIVGFVLYYLTIGKLVIKVSEFIINFIKSVFKILFKIFIKPFIIIFRWFYKKISPVCINIKNKSKIVHNNVKNGLKSKRNMVYNLCRRNIQNYKTNKRRKKGLGNKNDKNKTQRKKI